MGKMGKKRGEKMEPEIIAMKEPFKEAGQLVDIDKNNNKIYIYPNCQKILLESAKLRLQKLKTSKWYAFSQNKNILLGLFLFIIIFAITGSVLNSVFSIHLNSAITVAFFAVPLFSIFIFMYGDWEYGKIYKKVVFQVLKEQNP